MSQTAQRIFITGGRGRIASILSTHFAAQGWRAELFSRQPAPDYRGYAELLDPSVLSGATALLHLAWSTLPAQAKSVGEVTPGDDLALLEQILGALAACPPNRRPHLVFFSSGGAVYGNAPGRPNREEDPCHPIGAYGRAKLAAEKLIQARASATGLAHAILRVSNPYGYAVPRERQQGLIPHAIRCALTGQPLALWGDGSARKDFLHSTDFLSAISCVTDRRLEGTFNVCAGESHTVREVIALVARHADRPVLTAPQPAQAWDVHDSRLDGTKFCTAARWRPVVTLDEGIRRAVAAARG